MRSLALMTMLCLGAAAASAAAQLPATAPAAGMMLPVWAGEVPGESGRKDNEAIRPNQVVTQVCRPTVEVFLPEQQSATGTFLLICPGGGYNCVEYEKEGTAVAAHFVREGIGVGVLKYRTARWGEPKARETAVGLALQDAQRAMRLVRSRAGEWKINPARIGIGGFSAGGHLSANLALHSDEGDSSSADPIARFSCRPDFVVLIYGGFGDMKPGEGFPPVFLVHGTGDTIVSPDESITFAQAALRAKTPVELHLFTQAKHGFALGEESSSESARPAMLKRFLRANALLP